MTEATKNKLIDAFRNLYKVKSIEKITIKEITDNDRYLNEEYEKFFEYVTNKRLTKPYRILCEVWLYNIKSK